ncbi:MAG: DUF4184 family protein [Gemmatimonadaceae bacterium]
MPFTLSHPAAAAPFRAIVRHDRLPLEAFVIGTLMPDVEYLLRLEPIALLSHSTRGLFLFCLPAGLLTLILWEFLLREPVRQLFALPPGDDHAPRPSTWWMRSALALLAGSATHVFWDAFTHRDSWGPTVLPGLHTTAITIAGVDVPWYDLLQHVSTVIGGVVVGAWLWRTLRRHGAWPAAIREPWRQRTWLALGAWAMAVALWNAERQGMMKSVARSTIVLGRMAVGALLGAFVALVVYALVHRMRGRWAST